SKYPLLSACPRPGVPLPPLGNTGLKKYGMQEGASARVSQRVFSVLDRLLLTHPVWLQLALNQDSAVYILLREPVGTFLVRKCSSSQRKVLCLRVTSDKSASSVKECFICEEDSTFALESSALNFPDLCRLVAFYCISRDVLPFPLTLPEAIAKASTHRQLESIAHMGKLTYCAFSKVTNMTGLSQAGKAEETPGAPASAPVAQSSTEVSALALERRPAPSLAELDSSSSFSSMDSDSDSETTSEMQSPSSHRPPLMRSRGRGGIHRMSEAFVCFFAPDKRLTRLVEELSRDRRSLFGGTVQDFLLSQREALKTLASSSSAPRVTSVQLLQGMRMFLSQAKCCLLDSGELEPPIETLVPEHETAMFSCVLRPLRPHLKKALAFLHDQDGSSQRLSQNILRLKGDGAMVKLGVRTGVPDSREVERVKQKMTLMHRTHSPIDKVLLLLQICKCVHKAMGVQHGEGGELSWDDFLPSLSYVIVECNRPQLLLDVELMMELLEPSWLGGEGMGLNPKLDALGAVLDALPHPLTLPHSEIESSWWFRRRRCLEFPLEIHLCYY
uniref:Si:ch211-168d1.3 n=1 Tax=Neogobius melanostomus TaxID=47308 RepID=A0A8C6URE4_9GOBI